MTSQRVRDARRGDYERSRGATLHVSHARPHS
jgi:hypothetical protein